MRKKRAELTETERRVGWLMVTGCTVPDIAKRLGMSEFAVQIHGWHVCNKVRAWTRHDMAEKWPILES